MRSSPDGSVGAVPKYRTAADQVLVVCKKASAKRIRRSFRGNRKLMRKRLRQLGRCRFYDIQPAVDKARNGAIIRLMPGVYRELPSRRAPEPDPRCRDDHDQIGNALLASGVTGSGGGAPVANFEYQRKCPNAQNLIAIIGDGPDSDRVCDSKCNLQIEGMGRRRRDVLLTGPAGAPPSSNVLTGLPDCPGSPVLSPGIPTKTASQASCSTWDPFTNPDPPGCDWFTRPEEPR